MALATRSDGVKSFRIAAASLASLGIENRVWNLEVIHAAPLGVTAQSLEYTFPPTA